MKAFLKTTRMFFSGEKSIGFIENQATGITRPSNVKDIVHEPSIKLGNVDTSGRAGKYINHLVNLPTIPLKNLK